RVCPDAAPRLRAGRLSSAAFATGGLLIEVVLGMPIERDSPAFEVGYSARLRLEGDPPARVDPMKVFDFKAGLSSTDLASETKKAYYGLSFLVVERIVDRVGLEGLHAACVESARNGEKELRVERLLALADLNLEPDTWRAAIRDAMGPRELNELVR